MIGRNEKELKSRKHLYLKIDFFNKQKIHLAKNNYK